LLRYKISTCHVSTQLRCRYADIVAINSTHVGVLYEAGDTSFADRIQVRAHTYVSSLHLACV
jgi:hypothetical protein